MPGSVSFLRQLSGRDAWRSTSRRWANNNNSKCVTFEGGEYSYSSGWCRKSLKGMEGLNMYGDDNGGGLALSKRVMVVVDQTSHSKHAMMWALTHVADKGDLLTLLHVVPPSSDSYSPSLASSLGSLCKASKPEVEVEALVIQGPKFATVMSQVKKLEVSVLVLGQEKVSSLLNCFCGTSSSEDFVEECIDNAECWTIGVRKQSNGVSGYLITTRRQKDFWLLA